MTSLTRLSKWAKQQIPPVLIVLSLWNIGVTYKDEIREITIKVNSPNLSTQSPQDN